MPRRWWFKFSSLLLGTLACVLYVLPSILPEGALGFLGDKVVTSRVKLGLDLQGGMHLVYSVKVDKAVIDKVERYGEDLEDEIKKQKIPYERVSRIEGKLALHVAMKSPADAAKFESDIYKKEDYDRLFRVGERPDGGKTIELILLDSVVDDTRRRMADKRGGDDVRVSLVGLGNVARPRP